MFLPFLKILFIYIQHFAHDIKNNYEELFITRPQHLIIHLCKKIHLPITYNCVIIIERITPIINKKKDAYIITAISSIQD